MNVSACLILLLALVCSSPSRVHDDVVVPPNRPAYIAHYTEEAPAIDGRLSERIWSDAKQSRNWIDLQYCSDATYNTTFQSAWDETYLYFAISVEDPDIRASITGLNQRLFEVDNTIELFLDPSSDGLNYYEYQINAHGATWQLSLDKAYSQGGTPIDPSMIKGLKSAIHIDGTLNDDSDEDIRWTIEIAIPWSGLQIYMGAESLTDQRWSINLSRVFHHTSLEGPVFWVWSCAEQFNMHLPDTWGTLTFVKE